MTTSIKDTQVSVRLPTELKDRMETYAQLTGRSKSYVAMEALNEYLAWRIPQIDDLKSAVQAADRREFANDEEVEQVFEKLGSTDPIRRPGAGKATTRRK